MKIALLHVKNGYDVGWNEPIWPAYLKSYCQKYVPHLKADWSYVDSVSDAAGADVLGISCLSQDWDLAKSAISGAKKLGIPQIILGGQHITVFPNMAPDGVSVVKGSGERPFAKIIADLAGCDSYTWRHRDLDDIPIPDRRFVKRSGKTPYILTSRGCPFRCSFCSSGCGSEFSQHGARRIIAEILDILKLYPTTRKLTIWDDLFAANKTRLQELIDLMRSLKMLGMVKFQSSMRASIVDEPVCSLIKTLGITRVGIGAESGSDRLVKQLKDIRCSVSSNQKALDIMSGFNIKAGCGIIFGHWTETESDILETYRWLMKNYAQMKLSKHTISILTPIPGTPVWAWAEKHGHVSRNHGFNWQRLRNITLTNNTKEGRDRWFRQRVKDDSVYLNQQRIPQQTLFGIIEHYENRIARGDFGVRGKIGAGTIVKARHLASRIRESVAA